MEEATAGGRGGGGGKEEEELIRVEMMRLQNAVKHLQRSKLELEEAIREEGDGA